MPEKLKKTIKKHRAWLLAKENVVATGIGFKVTHGKRTSNLSIVCSVSKKVATSQLSSKALVPANLDGVPTDVIETGVIRALQSTTGKWRPAPGGVSIGHRAITAGTLGCLVKKDDRFVILSNNHVLADSNAAEIGDPILQPGPLDGGRYPGDLIASLGQFIPINFDDGDIPSDCPIAMGLVNFLNRLSGFFKRSTKLQSVSKQAAENLVDAAIAWPSNADDVMNEILKIGVIQGLVEAELGMTIKKSGRTTGLTTGEILQVDLTVSVAYGEGQVALFTDQLLAGAMSQGGDSGSAVLDESNNLVGLLFAGSESFTVMNRIQNVFSALSVSL